MNIYEIAKLNLEGKNFAFKTIPQIFCIFHIMQTDSISIRHLPSSGFSEYRQDILRWSTENG